jgi:hypothetical protein
MGAHHLQKAVVWSHAQRRLDSDGVGMLAVMVMLVVMLAASTFHGDVEEL